MEKPVAIGVDLGGTKIEIASVSSQGKIIKKVRLETALEGGHKAVEDQIVKGILDLGVNKQHLIGVGVGLAGQIAKDTGVVHLAPNLKWHDVRFQENLRKKLKTNVNVINDVRAAAWGEWILGAGRGCEDIVCLFVGTGIGSGIVSGSRMLTGATNSFGEVGHMVIDWKGVKCSCGNTGCFESIAGGWGIARRAKEAIKASPKEGAEMLKLAGGNIEKVSAKTAIEAYHAKDPLAVKLMNETVEALIAGCISIINGFNPAKLILGGGIIDATPEIVPKIDKGIKERALPVARSTLKVVTAELGKDAGVLGAAMLFFHA